jgi:hypothetical protein
VSAGDHTTAPPVGELPAPAEWMGWTESEKAWMSIRDADLLEVLMLGHARGLGRPLDVLEWGAGRSTLFYSVLLQTRGMLGSWLTLEHNREFFVQELAPRFDARPDREYSLIDGTLEQHARDLGSTGGAAVTAAVFDGGELRPYENDEDRDADLDDYVRLPAMLGRRFDLIVVDGRKRRRCLLEASRLLAEGGIAVLHDGWRAYYECAFAAFSSWTRVGDELWVGSQDGRDLRTLLPEHAFEGEEDG